MSNQFPTPFKNFRDKFKAYQRNLPMLVSGIAEQEFKENFKRQGYRDGNGVKKWKKRNPDTRPGRAILIKSGRLKRGFKKRPDANTARVINDVPYAKAHNEGDQSTVSIKGHTRTLTKANARFTNIKAKKAYTKKIKTTRRDHLVKAHSRKNNLPARPFMVTTPALLKDIDSRIQKDINTMFNSI
jgi:phage gpG-like protein